MFGDRFRNLLPWLWPVDVRWTVTAIATVAVSGGWATDIGPWYFELRQPAWKPPDWAFGPVWSLLYVTTGVACVRGWRVMEQRRHRRLFLTAAILHAVLNVFWSVLFFALRRPDWALVEAVALWLSAVWLWWILRRADRFAAWLILPLVAWLSVAFALNVSTVLLNPAFTT